MHALDFREMAPAFCPTAASIENLLHKVLATTTPDEICFAYFPPEEITFYPETQEIVELRWSLVSFQPGSLQYLFLLTVARTREGTAWKLQT